MALRRILILVFVLTVFNKVLNGQQMDININNNNTHLRAEEDNASLTTATLLTRENATKESNEFINDTGSDNISTTTTIKSPLPKHNRTQNILIYQLNKFLSKNQPNLNTNDAPTTLRPQIDVISSEANVPSTIVPSTVANMTAQNVTEPNVPIIFNSPTSNSTKNSGITMTNHHQNATIDGETVPSTNDTPQTDADVTTTIKTAVSLNVTTAKPAVSEQQNSVNNLAIVTPTNAINDIPNIANVTIATTTAHPVKSTTIQHENVVLNRASVPTTIKHENVVLNRPIVPTTADTQTHADGPTLKPAVATTTVAIATAKSKAGRPSLVQRLMLNNRARAAAAPVMPNEPSATPEYPFDEFAPAFDIGEVPKLTTTTQISMPSFYDPTPPPWLLQQLVATSDATTRKVFAMTVPSLDDGQPTDESENIGQLVDTTPEGIPVGATNAIIISSIIGGCAIAFFSVVMGLCIWRQHRSRRPNYPPMGPMAPTTSMTSINSKKSVGLFER